MMVRRTRRTGGPAICLGLVLAAVLSGCNVPVDAYRSLSGLSKNDPDPATAPFTANLDTAEGGSYGNLASVPPPPTVATTVTERQKLTENLTGQRTSTEAKDASGQPGSAVSGPVPPPPPIPPSIAAPEMAALAPAPKPETPVPPVRKMDEPPVPLPPDTTMQTPQIANAPGVEPPHSTPAPGHPSAMPQPASSALPPAAVASANPQPSPPPATLPAPAPSPQAAAMPPPKLPPTPMTVAALDMPQSTAALAAADQARLAQVVAQYQANPRSVRVVAYAEPGVGSAEQLNAFRLALDRAQAIAKELTEAGIPANKIQTEAAPSSATAPAGRVEVQLLQ
jgi:outer membrane protein OmpA-like peptidoglycan-associated protein